MEKVIFIGVHTFSEATFRRLDTGEMRQAFCTWSKSVVLFSTTLEIKPQSTLYKKAVLADALEVQGL